MNNMMLLSWHNHCKSSVGSCVTSCRLHQSSLFITIIWQKIWCALFIIWRRLEGGVCSKALWTDYIVTGVFNCM